MPRQKICLISSHSGGEERYNFTAGLDFSKNKVWKFLTEQNIKIHKFLFFSNYFPHVQQKIL